MITVYGEGRGFRVVWLLEEMGLPYRLRDVDLLKDLAKEDPEFLAINPAGFIPALVDGDVTMVESIACRARTLLLSRLLDPSSFRGSRDVFEDISDKREAFIIQQGAMRPN